MAHVANAIKMDERAYGSDNEEECASERVDVDSYAEGQIP